jgi:hypothetical protein
MVLLQGVPGAGGANNAAKSQVRSHGPIGSGMGVRDYNITFTESGLPSGTSWYVNLTVNSNKVTGTSTTASIVFSETNGNYTYVVDSPIQAAAIITGLPSTTQYIAKPALGSVEVNGANASAILITYTTQYLLVMSATPTTDVLVFPGIAYENAGSVITITAISETPNLVFSGWTGICIICTTAYSGSNDPANVTMGGVMLETATFVNRTYNATFNEKGLPANTSWSVVLNGTTGSSTTSTVRFSEPTGTYAYTVNQATHGYGARFNPTPVSGRMTINLDNASANVSFSPEYLLNVAVGLGGCGTVAPVGGWLYGGSIVELAASPNPGCVFTGWQGTGAGSYTGTENQTKLKVTGPMNETATFGKLYNVAFEENGLPVNTTWSVTLDGVTANITSGNFTFQAIDGAHNYSLGLTPGYMPDLHAGVVKVNGTNMTVVVNFTRVMYEIPFAETGLPSGTNWSVTLAGTEIATTGAEISFQGPNGTYSFKVTGISGYKADPSSGTIVLNGSSAAQTVIKFTVVVPPPHVFGINGTGGFVVLVLVLAIPLVIAAIIIAVVAFPRARGAAVKPDQPVSDTEEESKETEEPAEKHESSEASTETKEETATEAEEMDT